MIVRHFVLVSWLGNLLADLVVLFFLLLVVVTGSRFIVMKLNLNSKLTSFAIIISIWIALSVISDLTLHQVLSRDDWKTYFGSSLIVQDDFWILFIFCELVGPILIIWLLRSNTVERP